MAAAARHCGSLTDGRHWPVAGECDYESHQFWSMPPSLTAGADSISAHDRDAGKVKPSWWPCEEAPGGGASATSYSDGP
jgi:hypothetical protein